MRDWAFSFWCVGRGFDGEREKREGKQLALRDVVAGGLRGHRDLPVGEEAPQDFASSQWVRLYSSFQIEAGLDNRAGRR
jgi:hypothetical protein